MSDRPSQLRVDLEPAVRADLAAVARSLGKSAGAMVAEIVAEWIGPRLADAGAAKVQDVARRRLATLHAWRRAGRPDEGRDGVSRATLYRWELRWQGKGLGGLVDGRTVAVRPPRSNFGKFVAEMRRVAADARRDRPGLSAVYRRAAERANREGWAVPTLRTASRIIGGTTALFARRANKVRPGFKSRSNPTRGRPSGQATAPSGRPGKR
jgi:hypothetical protein